MDAGGLTGAMAATYEIVYSTWRFKDDTSQLEGTAMTTFCAPGSKLSHLPRASDWTSTVLSEFVSLWPNQLDLKALNIFIYKSILVYCICIDIYYT